MATGLNTKLDYGDYCAIPPDGKRYELIGGEVHVTPAPSPRHQELVGNLFVMLRAHFRPPAKVFVSPIDVILSPLPLRCRPAGPGRRHQPGADF